MAKMPEAASIFVDDIEVGEVMIKEAPKRSSEITLDFTFRPNWPGIWKAQAWALDTDPPA